MVRIDLKVTSRKFSRCTIFLPSILFFLFEINDIYDKLIRFIRTGYILRLFYCILTPAVAHVESILERVVKATLFRLLFFTSPKDERSKAPCITSRFS